MGFRGRLILVLWGLGLLAPQGMAVRADEPADPTAAVSKHKHKGLFGWRHCVECQRARLKAHEGIEMPPPPALDPAVTLGAQHHEVQQHDESAPGVAVVGETPGAEPAPVGMATVRSGVMPATPMDARRSGMMDSAVTPTSVPPAQTPLGVSGHNRPHIIGHILGFRSPGRISRAREEAERSRHASIAYGQGNQPVTELPASVVYGSGGR